MGFARPKPPAKAGKFANVQMGYSDNVFIADEAD